MFILIPEINDNPRQIAVLDFSCSFAPSLPTSINDDQVAVWLKNIQHWIRRGGGRINSKYRVEDSLFEIAARKLRASPN